MGKPRPDDDLIVFIRYELRLVRAKIKCRIERERRLLARLAAIRKGEAWTE